MFRLPSEKEEHKTTIGALILSIIIIIAGIGSSVYRERESRFICRGRIDFHHV